MHNSKEKERSVSLTSLAHTTFQLMPTQKFMSTMLEVENTLAPTGPFTMPVRALVGSQGHEP